MSKSAKMRLSMTPSVSLEDRLAAMEAAIADLQKQLAESHGSNWIEQITGSFKDEPAFEEVLAYGRAIRQADRTSEAGGEV